LTQLFAQIWFESVSRVTHASQGSGRRVMSRAETVASPRIQNGGRPRRALGPLSFPPDLTFLL